MKWQVDKATEKTNSGYSSVKWRQHEIIFFSILAIILITGDVWDMFSVSSTQMESVYGIPAIHAQRSYYYRNVLLPQVCTVVLLYLGYICINTILIPLAGRISLKDAAGKIIQRITVFVFLFLLVSYLLAIGINTATYYARPHLTNYAGFNLLALFGYNDHPLTDMWTGFDRAIAGVALFSLIACIRGLIVYYVERKSGPRKFYLALVLNQFAIFGVAYFSVICLLGVFGFLQTSGLRIIFTAFVPSTFLVFMINTYWLFPLQQTRPLFHYSILARLLLTTLLCTFPFFTQRGFVDLPYGLSVAFTICWVIQLFVTTPVSWVIFQQRKDKILQLKGAQQALVQSKADLQFLRSQVNPHFLFNTLNTLYGTALQEGAHRTAEAVQKLGDMMRFMLHENNLDFIPMHREIAYMENYISLQRLRIQASPGIVIEDNINGQQCHHQVAPMLLIPFIENAFKHGISLKEDSWIKIKLVCDASAIHFEVRNSIHMHNNHDPEQARSGIGMQNVRERLQLVYPDRHTFQANDNGKEFVVQLSVRP